MLFFVCISGMIYVLFILFCVWLLLLNFVLLKIHPYCCVWFYICFSLHWFLLCDPNMWDLIKTPSLLTQSVTSEWSYLHCLSGWDLVVHLFKHSSAWTQLSIPFAFYHALEQNQNCLPSLLIFSWLLIVWRLTLNNI